MRWQGCEEIVTLLHCWWECEMVQLLWTKSLTVPQKGNVWLRNSTPMFILRTKHQTCTRMFIASFIRAQVERTQASSADEGKKQCCIEWFSVICTKQANPWREKVHQCFLGTVQSGEWRVMRGFFLEDRSVLEVDSRGCTTLWIR